MVAPAKPALKFAIHGALGRMGQAVARLLTDGGHIITARFDVGDRLDLSQVEAVIDFSTPDASLNLAEAAAKASLGRDAPLILIVGTTGLSPDQEVALGAHAGDLRIVRSGNFSLGVNLLCELVRQAAERLSSQDFDIEIFEAHHRRKADAPSGTALMLGAAAASGRQIDLSTHKVAARDGLTGPRREGDIGFSVLRGGGIIGEHVVSFASDEEILTLSHSARDRSLFAHGAIHAALWAKAQPCGIYAMADVLGF